MTQVSQSEFFKALKADARDIMPTIVSAWDAAKGYNEEWRTNNSSKTLFGKSTSGTAINPAEYWLA